MRLLQLIVLATSITSALFSNSRVPSLNEIASRHSTLKKRAALYNSFLDPKSADDLKVPGIEGSGQENENDERDSEYDNFAAKEKQNYVGSESQNPPSKNTSKYVESTQQSQSGHFDNSESETEKKLAQPRNSGLYNGGNKMIENAQHMRLQADNMDKQADEFEKKGMKAGVAGMRLGAQSMRNAAARMEREGKRMMEESTDIPEMPSSPQNDEQISNMAKTSLTVTKKSSNVALPVALSVGIGVPVVTLIIAAFSWCFWRRRRQHSIVRKKMHIFIAPDKNCQNDYQYQKPGDLRMTTLDDKWRIEDSLVMVNYDAKLGSGAFCTVFKGRIIGEAPICKVYPAVKSSKFYDCECAVKMLPDSADKGARSDFAQEINFMKTLQYHAHLVSMLGWVDNGNSPKLLVEYCKHGDLLSFLRSRRDEIIHGYENSDVLKIRDLVSFGWQISNGLEYLSSLGCIHRDVAARNVLVEASYTAKIGDFGLCRLSDTLLYTGHGGKLPMKWMAPESLESFEYTHKSDVWSYGVLLYELFSFGDTPYALVDCTELLALLKSGKRLVRPPHCPLDVYALMQRCWKIDPQQRPSFSELCLSLATILESAAENYGYVTAVEDYSTQTVSCESPIKIPVITEETSIE